MEERHCKFCDRKLPPREPGTPGRGRDYCRPPRTCKQQARARRTRIALELLRTHGKHRAA